MAERVGAAGLTAAVVPVHSVSAAQIRDVLEQASDAPCEHSGVTRFGPLPVVVRSTDAGMVEHALRHSSGDPASAPWAPITVHLLDRSTIATDRFPAGLTARPPNSDGPSWVFVDQSCVATSSSSMLWLADAVGRRALRWTETPAEVPEWEAMRPLRFALRWAAAQQGAAMLHCAAVAGPAGAVLLVGSGGAGKSTTSFACVGSGLHLLGDDYCIVEPSDGSATVHATYVLGTLDDNSLTLLPHLRERVIGPAPRGKSLVTLDSFHDHLSAPVVAACAVVQAPGERTRLVPMSRMTLLRALAPSTLVQIPGVSRETFAAAAEVVRRVDTYQLRVGDLGGVPRVLGDLVGLG